MHALSVLCWILAAGLVVVGVAGLFSPQTLARFYGLPVDGESAVGFVRAASIRDIIIGAVLAAALYYHDEPLILIIAIGGIVLSLADLSIAYRHSGKQFRREHGGHAAGAVAFVLVVAMILLAIGR